MSSFSIPSTLLLRSRLLEKQISLLEKEMSSLPRGNLLCLRNGKYTKWHISNGKSLEYLPKKERELAQKLALRKYYSLRPKELLAEYKSLNLYTKESSIINSVSPNSSSLLDESSPYRELFQDQMVTADDKINSWLGTDYIRHQGYPEKLIHRTLDGNWVRSKSEVLIANALYLNHVPYRYECLLELGEMTFFPDFTILHPATMEIYYWEQFKSQSRESQCAKLRASVWCSFKYM